MDRAVNVMVSVVRHSDVYSFETTERFVLHGLVECCWSDCVFAVKDLSLFP